MANCVAAILGVDRKDITRNNVLKVEERAKQETANRVFAPGVRKGNIGQ